MILQNVPAFKSKEPPMVMKKKDNRNKPHHCEHQIHNMKGCSQRR